MLCRGLSEEAMCKSKPKHGEGESQIKISGKHVVGRGKGRAKAPRCDQPWGVLGIDGGPCSFSDVFELTISIFVLGLQGPVPESLAWTSLGERLALVEVGVTQVDPTVLPLRAEGAHEV